MCVDINSVDGKLVKLARIFYTPLLLRPFTLVWLGAVTICFIDQTIGRMAHLPPAEIIARRNAASQDIIAEWQQHQGQDWYALQCPCRIDCGCMSELEVPRLVLSNCMYPGELDYFFVVQPFHATYDFKVRWHCDICKREMSCGEPNH